MTHAHKKIVPFLPAKLVLVSLLGGKMHISVRVTALPALQKHHTEVFVQCCITITVKGSLSSKASTVCQTVEALLAVPVFIEVNQQFTPGSLQIHFEDTDCCGRSVAAATGENVAKMTSLAKTKRLIKEDP